MAETNIQIEIKKNNQRIEIKLLPKNQVSENGTEYHSELLWFLD